MGALAFYLVMGVITPQAPAAFIVGPTAYASEADCQQAWKDVHAVAIQGLKVAGVCVPGHELRDFLRSAAPGAPLPSWAPTDVGRPS